MTGWKEVNIGSLGEVITGNTPPTADREYYGGHYPFIKPTDMDLDRRRVTKWEENFTEKAFKKYKNSYIPLGATGVVTIGTVGEKIFQADQNCFTNQSVNVVIPNSNYDQDFVYYLLKLNLPKVSAANPGTASGRHHVSKSNFCAINVLVPNDKLLQAKIGQILSAYDNLIENNLKRIKLLEELAERTYDEWFVKFRVNGEGLEMDVETGLPKGWEKKKIGECCNVSGGGTPSRAINEYWTNGAIPWFSPTDLSKSDSIFQIDSSDKITDLGLKKSSAKLLQSNSFMMTSRATIGLFAITDKPFCTNQGFINVTPFEIFQKEYLFYNFKNRVPEFKGNASGTTFLELSKSKFKVLDLNWPQDNLLVRFHEFVNPIHKMISFLINENFRLKEARDILLPRLMNSIISISPAETKPGTKIVQFEPPQKQVSLQFKEAVLISLLTSKFGSEKYPLGRMRYTKLSYLFHRHADNQIKDYLRKAAGPYNPKTKYGGPEKIAHGNGYVIDHKNGQLTGFIAGPNIEEARLYFEKYWNIEYLTWLEAQFKYKSNDDLELFATVDNSLIELNKNNEPFTVETVKKILEKEPEWKAKLKREIFNDINIQRAVTYLPTIFQY